MKCREADRKSSVGTNHRSYLVLSMILLIWNTAAHLVHSAQDAVPETSVRRQAEGVASRPKTGEDLFRPDVSARGGPLSRRQKFLLGNRIDINTASEEEISELPGISAGTAAEIVARRKRAGAFRSAEELLTVRGIKRKRLEKILPFLAEMENN